MITDLKILMLEDSDADAEMVQRMAKKSDYNCQFKVMMTREVYEKALVEFKPDIILSDNAMPQFSASEALQILQQHDLHIPFILVTGTVSEEFAASIIKAGADDYLLKDRLTRLPAAIEAALKQKQTEKEKREAAQGLQQSEEKYRSMMQRVSDAFISVDKDGNYTYVNYKAAAILKSKPEDMVGENMWLLFPHATELPFYKAFYNALETQQYVYVENYYEVFDFWLENHIYPSPDGVSVYFRDITEKKKAEALLKEERDKFAKIATTSPGLIYSMRQNKAGVLSYSYASDAVKEIYGFVFEEIENAPHKIFELIHPDDTEFVMKSLHHTKTYLVPLKAEYRYCHPTKGLVWHEVNSLPVEEPGGDVVCHGIIMDITERKNAEQKVIKANRLYFFISQINQMIVRTTDEITLFNEVCHIAVELGKFRMAWIGMIDEQTKKIIPVMHAGEESGYLSITKSVFSIDDNPEGHGPTGTAAREGKYIVCNDIENDDRMIPWKEDALARGYNSSMSLPVKKFGKVIGSFSVYASEKFFFDAEEIALLEEATGDISFALEVFEKELLRKKAEDAIKLSEDKYMSLVNTIDGIVWEADAETFQFSFVSRQAERLLGYSTDQWLNTPSFWGNHIYEEDRNWAIEFCVNNTRAKKPHEFEYRMVTANGSIVWLRDIVSVIMEDEMPLILRGIMSDITERKKSEEALIKSEQRYHTLADVSPVGIFHTDAAGNTTYVNPKWCEISGLAFEEALGYGWLNAVHQQDKKELIEGWEKATGVKEFSTSEYRFIRPDGSIAWVLGLATPERNDNNEVVGYVGTITNITERKKAEEEIKTVNQRFEIIAAATNDAVFEVDLITGQSSHNKAFIELLDFGVGHDGKNNRPIWRSKLHPDDRERVIDKLEATYAGTATTWSDEFRFKKADGSYGIFYDRASIIRDDAGKAIRFLGSMVEITDLKKAEEEIKKSNERFELIAKATNDGLWDWNLETYQVWGNEMHQQLYGLTVNDPVPSNEEWEKRIHPEDRESTVKALEDAKASGQLSYVHEYRFYAESTGWMNIYGRTLIQRNTEGKAVRLVGSMMDITERKKTEEQLVANEKRFRKLIENGNDAFAILNIEGKALYISASVERVLGYTEEEITHLNLFSLTHPEDREEVEKAFKKAIDNPGVTIPGYTSRLLHKDGTYHWFEDTITNLIDDPDIRGIVDNFRDVTERINNQTALAESEVKHRDIVENITDILCTHDLEGNVLSVNATVKKVLGYEVEEMLRMNIQDILLPYSKERFGDYVDALQKNGFAQGLMYVQTSTGQDRVWEFRNTLRTIDGKAPFVYGFAQDVTERIAAEDNIKNANERFEQLAKATNDIIWDWNLQTQEIWWNDNYYNFFGSGHAIPAGINTWKDIIHPKDKDRVWNAIHKAIKNGETFWDDEYRCISKTGKELFIYDRGFILYNDAGKPYRMVGSMLDFTERKIAEEEIKSSEEKRRLIMNAALDGIICIDTEGLITFWNPQAEQIFGWQEAEVMGQLLSTIIIPEPFRKMHDNGIKHYLKTGEGPALNRLLQLKAINRQGVEFTVELTVLPIKQANEEFFCAFVRDITQRIKAEAAIKESEEKYRTLVEQASDGIFIADDTGKFIMVNSSGCKLSGYSAEELKELTIYDLVNKEGLVTNPFKFEEMHQPQGGRSERKLLCKNGTEQDVEISAKFLSDKRFIAFVRDISERIKAEEAIKVSEEKYRSLVEQASDAIFIADINGQFVTVNTSACKLSQYTAEELLQMTIYDFIVEEDIKRQAFRFEELKQGKTTVTERVMRGNNGILINVEITSKLLSDGRLLAFVRDIGERIKAQNEIIKEKNLSDSIINSLPASFFMISIYGKILRWNRHLEIASKYSTDEIGKMKPLDFFEEADKEILSQKIANVFLAGEDNVEAVVCLKTGEKLPYYFKGIAIEYDGEPCIMGVGIDISERVKAQEEIKQTSEKLRQLTAHLQRIREDERKRIGREIHDELGQQLTAIKMDVAWIDKKTTEETPLIKNKLKNIITLLDGSNQAIRRILSELRPGILDDNGLLEAMEWLNRQFTTQSGVPVIFETTETELKLPEPVATCVYRIYQEAFTNITRYAHASKIATSLEIINGKILVTIEDDGKGFDPIAAQNKKSFGILGMKERILSLNGTFQLISAPGKGTKIAIALPLTV